MYKQDLKWNFEAFLSQASDANASPWPWKNKKDKPKSKTKMRTKEMTTALVVDSPTPFAPPVVVNPHEQLTCNEEIHQIARNSRWNSHMESREVFVILSARDAKQSLSIGVAYDSYDGAEHP